MAKTKAKSESKITLFSYLFSIFNKNEFLDMDSKVYSKFMINRFLSSLNVPSINSVVDELNQLKYQNISDEHHYFILFNAVEKGWYKLPKKLIFTENTQWNKMKSWLSKFGNTECLSIKDISFVISLMNEDDREKLFERIELLEKEG